MDSTNVGVSILITAYNRKEYLLSAIQSALNQDFEKSNYEIIVVKNFEDNEIDKYISSHGVKSIISNHEEVGLMLADGIENCKGDVICFLDDDDIFTERKLSTIYKIFSYDSEVTYVHNQQVFIDVYGDERPEYISKKKIPRPSTFENTSFKNVLKISREFEILPDYLWFNLSSVSIRRNVIIFYLSYLANLKGHTDDFLFFSAFSFQKKSRLVILIDALTKYRNHSSATNVFKKISSNERRKRRAKMYTFFADSTRLIISMVKDESAKKYLKSRLRYEELMLYNVNRNFSKLFFHSCLVILKRDLRWNEAGGKRRLKLYLGFLGMSFLYLLESKPIFRVIIKKIFPVTESLS